MKYILLMSGTKAGVDTYYAWPPKDIEAHMGGSQAPRMIRAYAGSVRDGPRQFRQDLAVKGDTAGVGNTASLVRAVKIATAILADLNDGMVVLARDLHHEVIDALGPDLQTRYGRVAAANRLDV